MGIMDKILGKDKDDDHDKEKKSTADFSDVRGSDVRGGAAARADFSDVVGGSDVIPGDTTGQRTYTVVSGDTLSKIAKREYGDASKWHAIYEANRDTIKNPDLIYPGQVLTLPSDA